MFKFSSASWRYQAGLVTQCLKPPPWMFISGISFRVLKHMTLTPSTISSPSPIHPALFSLFLLTNGVYPSSSSFIYHTPIFPFLTSTATIPHSANLTASLLFGSCIPLPGDCGSLEDNRQEAGPWCASIGELHLGSPKTKVEAGTTGWMLIPCSFSSFLFSLFLFIFNTFGALNALQKKLTEKPVFDLSGRPHSPSKLKPTVLQVEANGRRYSSFGKPPQISGTPSLSF